MTRRVTVRYDESKYDRQMRYIHKYYLPQDLKRRIFPVDIYGVVYCFSDEDQSDIRKGMIPENDSDCLICYKDIGLEKPIDGPTARRVLLAYGAYFEDCVAELTAEENRTAMNLNNWLIEWEKSLVTECIRLSEETERRVRSSDVWLNDYEMDLEVSFYVRDDDPFSEDSMPDAGSEDIDSDTAFLCETTILPLDLPVSKKEAAKNDYWGVGDSRDHNDRHGLRKEEIYSVKHCATFHELYDHLHLPMKHMGRIGRIYADIIIRHQNGVRISLAGEAAIAVQEESRIRPEILPNDDKGEGAL